MKKTMKQSDKAPEATEVQRTMFVVNTGPETVELHNPIERAFPPGIPVEVPKVLGLELVKGLNMQETGAPEVLPDPEKEASEAE